MLKYYNIHACLRKGSQVDRFEYILDLSKSELPLKDFFLFIHSLFTSFS